MSIFLYVIMDGAWNFHNPGSEVEILSRVWIAGVILSSSVWTDYRQSLWAATGEKAITDTLGGRSTYQWNRCYRRAILSASPEPFQRH